MSQQLRFLEIKNDGIPIEHSNAKTKTPTEEQKIAYKNLKDICEGKNLETEEEKEKIFKERDVNFTINAYDNEIKPFLEQEEYMIPGTNIYLVNTEMWQAIKNIIFRLIHQEHKQSFKELHDAIIDMVEIEKIFGENRLAVEAS